MRGINILNLMLKNNPKLQAKDIEAMSRVLSSVPNSLTKQMLKENKKTDIEKIFDKGGSKIKNIKKPNSKK
jgi:hypothetical protein